MKAPYDLSIKIGGSHVHQVGTQESDSLLATGATLNPSQDATLTTRGSNTAGTATINSTHNDIATNDLVDLYWVNVNGTLGQRYGMVATVSPPGADTVAITGGSGDNLPPLNTDVIVALVHLEAFPLVGSDAVALACNHTSSGRAIVNFLDVSNASLGVVLIAAPAPLKGQENASLWIDDTGFVNPLAGLTVIKVGMSHSGVGIKTATVDVAVMFN